MDNQTAKSIDRSLKNINGALNAISDILKKVEKNTRPTFTVPESPHVHVRSEEDIEKIASQIVSRFVEAGKAGE